MAEIVEQQPGLVRGGGEREHAEQYNHFQSGPMTMNDNVAVPI